MAGRENARLFGASAGLEWSGTVFFARGGAVRLRSLYAPGLGISETSMKYSFPASNHVRVPVSVVNTEAVRTGSQENEAWVHSRVTRSGSVGAAFDAERHTIFALTCMWLPFVSIVVFYAAGLDSTAAGTSETSTKYSFAGVNFPCASGLLIESWSCPPGVHFDHCLFSSLPLVTG